MLLLLDFNNEVAKKFWKHFKSMCKDTTSINVLHFNVEDRTDSETKASILNSIYLHLSLSSAFSFHPPIA